MTAPRDHALGRARRRPRRTWTPQRAQGFAQPLEPGVHFYPGVGTLALNEFALHGAGTSARSRSRPSRPGAAIAGRLPGRARLPRDDLGRQRPAARSACCSTATRSRPRTPAPTSTRRRDRHRPAALLARLAPQAEQHALTVELPPGVSAYDFTFGYRRPVDPGAGAGRASPTAWSRSSGVLTLNSSLGVLDLEQPRAERRDGVAQRDVELAAQRAASGSSAAGW